jgi:hypothetical protein
MTLTQILAWLSGPLAGSGISWLLEHWNVWANWEPTNALAGFNPKAVIVGIGSGILGLGAYALASQRPDIVNAADPYVQAAFPLLTLLAVQVWHAVINKRLNTTTISATAPKGGVLSATAISPGTQTNVDTSGNQTVTVNSGSNSPGQGS